MKNKSFPADLVRVADAVRLTGLRVTPYHVTRLIRDGKIPAQRIGSLWFIKPTDLTAALLQPEAAP